MITRPLPALVGGRHAGALRRLLATTRLDPVTTINQALCVVNISATTVADSYILFTTLWQHVRQTREFF